MTLMELDPELQFGLGCIAVTLLLLVVAVVAWYVFNPNLAGN